MTASGATATWRAPRLPSKRDQARSRSAKAMQEASTARQQAQQERRSAQAAPSRRRLRDRKRRAQRRRRERDRTRAPRDRSAIRQADARANQACPFPPFPGPGPQIPEGAVIISVAFFVMCAVIAIGFPLARAIARRMDKRNVVAPAATTRTPAARLERIEQAVDAIAVEVERISEGQRFTTKVIARPSRAAAG